MIKLSFKLMKSRILMSLLMTISFTSHSDTLNVPNQYSNIQSALNIAESADVIWVQPGTYIENLIWPTINSIQLISAGDTSNTFIDGGGYGRVITMNDSIGIIDTTTIIKGFTIQNGLLPVGEDENGVGLYINNCSPKLVNLRIQNNKLQAYASYGVGIYINRSNLVIEGLTISNSEIVGSNYVYGMGIFCDSSHININNLIISDLFINSYTNCYGAGIFARNSYLNISNFLYQDNHLTIHDCNGGAINAFNDTIILNDFEIKNNTIRSTYSYCSIYGGGIYLNQTIGEITSGSIVNNISNAIEDYSSSSGGGIFMHDFCNISLENIHVNENSIYGDDGAYGGGVFISDSSIVNIDSSSFNNNYLYSRIGSGGGGIYMRDNVFITINYSNMCNNQFDLSNNADMSGGGICVSDNSFISVYNSNINENFGTDGGSRYYGCGIFIEDSQMEIFNSVISNNNAGSYGTRYYGCGIYMANSQMEVFNSIVSNNISGSNGSWYYGGGIYVSSSQINMINSLISNNILGLYGNWYKGGGIYANDESDVLVINTTITGNRKPDYSSIYGSGICVKSSSLIMTNSISINENSNINNEFDTIGSPVGTIDVSFS
ncbi:MAG: hypothetical protein GQ527_04320, partial [Bacteroidales bacterium]|nr:hypothetical protein [Bacteroidales bacterium]